MTFVITVSNVEICLIVINNNKFYSTRSTATSYHKNRGVNNTRDIYLAVHIVCIL